MKIKIAKVLIIAFSILISVNSFAAQLVDSIPSALTDNWSICVHFQESDTICHDQNTPMLEQDFEAKVTRFIYQKDFIISSDLQSSAMAIWLDVVDDVDEVRINGHLIGKTGSFPPHFQSGFRYQRLYMIPSIMLKFNQFNQLEIKTFSSVNSPGLKQHPVVIGEYFEMAHHQQEADYIYVVSIAIFLILTIFQMFYYFLVKGSNETLYLSLYLVSFAVIAYARSQAPLHMGLDLSSTFKIEMFMISVAIVSFSFFVFRFFDLEVRKAYVIGILIMALPGLINIMYPDPLKTRIVAEYGYWIICLVSFITAGSAVVISIYKGKRYSWVVGAFCLSGWFFLSYDAVSQSDLFADLNLPLRPSLLLLATTAVGISMSLVITHKYWQIFKGATYDYLTGSLLRPAFFQRLSEEMQRSQQESTLLFVAVINIQQVKKISASYGHEVGNNLLLMVSDVLIRRLKPYDLVCHFSDDEFYIAARVESRAKAEEYLRKIHIDLSNTQQVVGAETELYIDAKLGGIIYNPDQHLSVSQLLQDANYGLAKAQNHHMKDYVLLNNPTVTA
jgi:diguanylate cyclase (GGDEF)-like protein